MNPNDNNNKAIVCRCEDLTEVEIEEAIDSGLHTPEEIKRALRIGMGPCQGKTCGPIVLSILARKLKKKPGDFQQCTQRAPLKPVPANVFFQESPEGEKNQ